MSRKRCKFCRCLFILTARNPEQKYCSRADCQKARKRRWQKMKMQGDKAYRLNQKDAQKRWCEKNPDYWQNYRKNNSNYTGSNRERQQHRNRCRRAFGSISREFAKMDALSVQRNDISWGQVSETSNVFYCRFAQANSKVRRAPFRWFEWILAIQATGPLFVRPVGS